MRPEDRSKTPDAEASIDGARHEDINESEWPSPRAILWGTSFLLWVPVRAVGFNLLLLRHLQSSELQTFSANQFIGLLFSSMAVHFGSPFLNKTWVATYWASRRPGENIIDYLLTSMALYGFLTNCTSFVLLVVALFAHGALQWALITVTRVAADESIEGKYAIKESMTPHLCAMAWTLLVASVPLLLAPAIGAYKCLVIFGSIEAVLIFMANMCLPDN